MTLLNRSSLRTAVTLFCGAAIAAGLALTPARADEFNKRTNLTVSQTVQIGDTVLQPGRYVIKLLDSQTDRHVVQIFNSNQTHIIATVVAVPIQRVVPRGHTTFTYYETPVGSARALRTWYYPGDEDGQDFVEPKHHVMLAAGTTVVESPLAFNDEKPEQPAPATQAANEPSTSTQTSSDASEQQSADRQATEPAPAQSEVAQNTTPATDSSSANQAAAQAPAQQTPAQLPQTGTLYPELGLSGALLLGLAGLSRGLRRA